MPTYDYFCAANARTLEVRHGMNENIQTWGELCARAQVDADDTPPDSPVTRLITGGNIISGIKSEAAPMPSLPPCAHGRCGCA